MGALTLLFAGLAFWQMQRLSEKTALIATIEERINEKPLALPSNIEWQGLPPETFDYRPLSVKGHFVYESSVLVFTSLDTPRGVAGGPGFWVMTPFVLDKGGTMIVNRGFIPQGQKDWFDGIGTDFEAPRGELTIVGIARQSEPVALFTPGPVAADRIEYVRNIPRLIQMMDPGLVPYAQFYLDEVAGAPGVLPQGGETLLDIPNRHLEYAMTWGALALVTPLMTLIWLMRARSVPARQS